MKKILFIIILLTIVININVFAKTYDLSQVSQIKLITEYNDETSVEEIDTVTFGSYPQSDISGNTKEPIEWLVLERSGNKVFLLSKYVLETLKFQDKGELIVWGNSKLRSWLNSDFLQNAFDLNEKDLILTTEVNNEPNEDFPKVDAGENTKDKIFILSINEIKKYFGVGVKPKWPNTYYRYKGKVQTKMTDYANTSIYNGRRQYSAMVNGSPWRGVSGFWLRNPGRERNTALHLGGKIDSEIGYELETVGRSVYVTGGVRPALWVTLPSTMTSNGGALSDTSLFGQNLAIHSEPDDITKKYIKDNYESQKRDPDYVAIKVDDVGNIWVCHYESGVPINIEIFYRDMQISKVYNYLQDHVSAQYIQTIKWRWENVITEELTLDVLSESRLHEQEWNSLVTQFGLLADHYDEFYGDLLLS